MTGLQQKTAYSTENCVYTQTQPEDKDTLKMCGIY